ncbi:ENR1 protein, partial [Machaerirhynchus nigripectus]|nr:ENR1 protein [Machaerirhynchus nigripectus]
NQLILPQYKNLYIDMIERIAKELNVSNCCVCGGTGMGEVWPCEGDALSLQEILLYIKKERGISSEINKEGLLLLKKKTIGKECLWRKGTRYGTSVGKIACKRYWVTNGTHDWWVPKSPDWYWAREE